LLGEGAPGMGVARAKTKPTNHPSNPL